MGIKMNIFFGRLRAIRRCTKGSGIVEFALITPIFLLFLFTILEFGRMAFTQGVLIYAADQATRYAIVNYGASTDQIKAQLLKHIITLNPGQISSVVVTAPVDSSTSTQLVTVQINYTFKVEFPLVPSTTFIMSGSSKGFLTAA